jgi:ribA/ribD-fused uncharacterized protein
MSLATDVEGLRRQFREGARAPIVPFLEPEPAVPGELGPECLCQWYPAPMDVDGVRFPTAEHYMMWCKARLFGDEDSAFRVLADPAPAVAKQLGRQVRGFEPQRWDRHKVDIVVTGSAAKFRQHPELGDYLRSTAGCVLAEASPVDLIWGIGFAADDPRAHDPVEWRGENLLGFALMQVRRGLG